VAENFLVPMSTTDGTNKSKNSFTKEGVIHFINSVHGTLPEHLSLATFITGLGTDFDYVIKKDYCFICCEVVFFWMVILLLPVVCLQNSTPYDMEWK